MRRGRGVLALGVVLVTGLACTAPESDLRLAWSPIESLNAGLPESVRVYGAADPSVPIRAWYVRVQGGGDATDTRVVLAAADDGLESASEIARRTGARVVINGGYFRTDQEAPLHVGLLIVDGRLIEPALRSLIRDGRRYFVARAALGIMADGGFDVAWVSTRDEHVLQWPTPPGNAPGAPGEEPDFEGLDSWSPRFAVAGGPVLVADGTVRITTDEEVFFDALGGAQPRTVAGVTSDGDLLAMIIDGRQRESRGANLREAANWMRELGAVEALNLDGGGSTTLVVDGVLVNRPLGSEVEREIMSAVTISAR